MKIIFEVLKFLGVSKTGKNIYLVSSGNTVLKLITEKKLSTAKPYEEEVFLISYTKGNIPVVFLGE